MKTIPIPLDHKPYPPASADQLKADIDVALLQLRCDYGANITVAPYTPPPLAAGFAYSPDQIPPSGDLAITLVASDGYTITRHAHATYQDVLKTLARLRRDEELTVCGTPDPKRPGRHMRAGQRFRPRTFTCGLAVPRRQQPTAMDGVWRCQDCKTKKQARQEAVWRSQRQRTRQKERS